VLNSEQARQSRLAGVEQERFSTHKKITTLK